MNNKEKKLIGKAVYVWLTDYGIKKIPARVDTGAQTSSLWASNIKETKDGLEFTILGEKSPLFTGEVAKVRHFTKVAVTSSNGHVQIRYRVPIKMQFMGRHIRTFCTLSDRSTQIYPVLIGRNTLNGKFIVDVHLGSHILNTMDQECYNKLQQSVLEKKQ